VELSWVHHEKEHSAQLTLAERPPGPTVQTLPVRPDPLGFQGRRPGGSADLEDRMLEMERRMDALWQELDRNVRSGMPQGSAKLRQRIELRENGALMRYEKRDGHATLRVEEDGEVLFTGPVNTPEERAKVPQPYRERLERHVEDSPQAPEKMR